MYICVLHESTEFNTPMLRVYNTRMLCLIGLLLVSFQVYNYTYIYLVFVLPSRADIFKNTENNFVWVYGNAGYSAEKLVFFCAKND